MPPHPQEPVSDCAADAIERVSAYIDGFNVYYGINTAGLRQYLWLDYRRLVTSLLRTGQELTVLKYFTSKVTEPADSAKRQDTYLNALRARGGIEIVEGEIERRRITCPSCGCGYKGRQEKMSDVNLAVAMVMDAVHDRYDQALLMSADSDLTAVVVQVRGLGKAVKLVDPVKRHGEKLATLVDHRIHLTPRHLRDNQLPDPVRRERKPGRYRDYRRPAEWS